MFQRKVTGWGGVIDTEFGIYDEGAFVDNIPEETDITKRRSYKFKNGKFEFDENRYKELLEQLEQERKEIELQMHGDGEDIEDDPIKAIKKLDKEIRKLKKKFGITDEEIDL